MFGQESYARPSRFLDEIPEQFLEEIRPRMNHSRPFVRATPVRAEAGPDMPFRHGELVRHRKFGEGTVVTFEGAGEHARIQVNFHQAGSKWLVLAYANLESVQ